ncbi:MAG: Nramp family divalent metal transporter [Planctomycetaceae bacterium]
MSSADTSTQSSAAQAPYPGSQAMPRWNLAELPLAPTFGWKNWAAMLGPGLVLGGAAIGGGEWLSGPMITARYGGALMWLGMLSILGQLVYNCEISRYTLYTGEPIFTGKFRLLPGPSFWVLIYLALDFGSVFPYLAANAATPLATVIRGYVPDPKIPADKFLLSALAYVIFLGAMIPLIIGGKVYNSLKAIMTFKIFMVMGFLLVVGFSYISLDTWIDVFGGLFKVGNVPIRAAEDRNNNGILDPGEDWDKDGRLDVIEPETKPIFDTDNDRKLDSTDVNLDGKPDPTIAIPDGEKTIFWPDLDEDGQPDSEVMIHVYGDERLAGPYPLDADGDGKLDRFIDIDGDGVRDGANVDNVFVSQLEGRGWPEFDWSTIAVLSVLVAISGSGGLSNTPVSNYTRDQGWGMGHHVGAIPSVVGGHNIQLSHEGTVFTPTPESMPHWKRWYRHVAREQIVVWGPACLFGLALPSLLSAEFLPRGAEMQNQWEASVKTAGAIQDRIGGPTGETFWYLTLLCGFVVLAPSMAVSADGVIRRWVDVFWTSSATLRKLPPQNIRYVYFGVLSTYILFGLVMLSLEPGNLIKIATTIFNFALGFSCWHTLFVNCILLPKELRPNLFIRIAMIVAGLFFWIVATISAYVNLQELGWI